MLMDQVGCLSEACSLLLVVHVVPVIEEALAHAAKRCEGLRAHHVEDIRVLQLGVVDGLSERRALHASDALGHAAACVSGKRHAVAAIAGRVKNAFLGIGRADAGQHVVADIDPAPP